MGGGDARRLAGTDAALINHFMQWFQEAKWRALVASRKAASSVFADVGDDEESSIAAEAAPVRLQVTSSKAQSKPILKQTWR